MDPRMAAEASKILGETVYRLWGPGPGGFIYTRSGPGMRTLHLYNVRRREAERLSEGPVRVAAGSEAFIVYAVSRHNGSILEIHDGAEAQPVMGFKPGKVTGLAVTKDMAAASVSLAQGVEVRIINPREAAVTSTIMLEEPFRVEAIHKGLVLGVDDASGRLGVLDPSDGRLHLTRPPGGGRVKQVRLRGDDVSVLVSNIVDEVYIYDIETGFREKVSSSHETPRASEILDHGWLDGALWTIARGQGTWLQIDGRRINARLKGNPKRAAPIPGGLAVEYSSITMPSRIALIEDPAGKARVRIPRDMEKAREVVEAGVREIHIEARGQVRVPLLIAEPRGAPKPGGVVVYIHEGPWSRVRDEWNPVIATLLLLGYRVVAPNYRGSSGEGRHYADLVLGDPGGGDVEDVVEAARWARSQGLGEQIHLVGRGYGGYLAILASMEAPGIVRSVAAENPIVNWVDEASSGDVGDRCRADALFQGDTELMARRSLTELGVPKTRILIVSAPHRARSILSYAATLIDSGVDISLHVDRNSESRFILELALFLAKPRGRG
ncbi:MAG: alpha/beta fold hydrolase [Desulfurococcales archaeon]|nr:alpha/beta fold hydrolase [Desulfurococcales archaeon]